MSPMWEWGVRCHLSRVKELSSPSVSFNSATINVSSTFSVSRPSLIPVMWRLQHLHLASRSSFWSETVFRSLFSCRILYSNLTIAFEWLLHADCKPSPVSSSACVRLLTCSMLPFSSSSWVICCFHSRDCVLAFSSILFSGSSLEPWITSRMVFGESPVSDHRSWTGIVTASSASGGAFSLKRRKK